MRGREDLGLADSGQGMLMPIQPMRKLRNSLRLAERWLPAHVQGFRQNAVLRAGHALIRPRLDDRYIASYPRSGNTWLRTMLVNVMDPNANSDPDLFNQRIPGVSLANLPLIAACRPPRIIKTHSWYQPSIQSAVYLVRDGRDVLISLYHYRVTRQGHRESFSQFFERYCLGVYGHRWDESVESWLRAPGIEDPDRFLVVRFEDLRSNTTNELQRICTFLTIPSSLETCAKAVEAASFEHMRVIERQRRPGVTNTEKSFYRGGASGKWNDLMDAEMQRRFMELSSQSLSLAGYRM